MKGKTVLAHELRGSMKRGRFSEPINARMRGKTIIIQKKPQPVSDSAAQAKWREKYSEWVDEWNALTDNQKAAYQPAADIKRITAFNEFMSEKLMSGVFPEQMYERYITGESGWDAVFGADWLGQTFTVGTTGDNYNHNITKVKLLLGRTGSPGTLTVEIYAADGAGKPTGAVLSTGSINGNDIQEMASTTWYDISMSSYQLSASTKYALVIYAAGGDSDNRVWWRNDDTSPTYTGGAEVESVNSGGTWNVNAGTDCLFEEYGQRV